MSNQLNKTVFSNALWIIICRVVKVVLAALLSIFTARFLGPSDFGIINFAASVTAFLAPFVLMGFNSILVQEFLESKEEEGTVLGTAILSSSIFALLGVILSTIFAFLVAPSDTIAIKVTAIYSCSLIFQATELIQFWFQAKFRSKVTAIVGVIAYVVISLYKIFLLFFGANVYWFAATNAFDYCIISFVLIFICKKETKLHFKFSKKTYRHLVQKGWYYALSSFMVTLFAQIDKIMIKTMLGNSANGVYAVALTCASMPIFVFAAIIEAMRPYILTGKKESQQIFEKRLSMLYSILIYLAISCSTFVCLTSNFIIKYLYGSDYTGAVPVLQILIWYIMLSCIGGAKDIWILAEQKQKYLLWLNVFGALTNVCLNYCLIPVLGIAGAAIATLFTQFTSNILLCVLIKPLRRNMHILLQSLNPIILINSFRYIKHWKRVNKE